MNNEYFKQNEKRDKQMYNSLKSKYVGLGDADTKRQEFLDNIKRDTYSSLIGHDPLLTHLSVGLGKPKQIVRHELIDKMSK